MAKITKTTKVEQAILDYITDTIRSKTFNRTKLYLVLKTELKAMDHWKGKRRGKA